MKKIVSVLAVAALTLSAVFAADITIEYKTRGNVYSETNNKTTASDGTVTSSQTRTFLDQDGYGKAQSHLKIKANTDFAGFLLSVDPDASNGSGDNGAMKVDEYYGYMNFGNLQLTTGNWTSRYVNRVTTDAGKWEGKDFEKYKPGIQANILAGTKADKHIDGSVAVSDLAYGGVDVDNLTRKEDGKQELSTSLAYTIRPSDTSYILIKALAIDGEWGTMVGDHDRSAEYNKYDIKFMSGFAGEVAVKIDNVFDLNVIAKSLARDHLTAALFFRPLMLGSTNMLFGFTYSTDLKEYKTKTAPKKDIYKHNQYAYGIDFRARFPLSENLALTTMNNLSVATLARADGDNLLAIYDRDYSAYALWDMVSLAYKANEKLTLQFTVESQAYWGYGANVDPETKTAKPYKDLYVKDAGGFEISVIPGVVYKFNSNASLTAGVRIKTPGIGSSSDYRENNKLTSEIAIPFVFDVAL